MLLVEYLARAGADRSLVNKVGAPAPARHRAAVHSLRPAQFQQTLFDVPPFDGNTQLGEHRGTEPHRGTERDWD